MIQATWILYSPKKRLLKTRMECEEKIKSMLKEATLVDLMLPKSYYIE